MHPALVIPEIVLLILHSGLEFSDVVNAALVCRTWSEWALEVRWRAFKIPIRAVIQVLAPVESIPYGMYAFQGEIAQVQWRRFVETSKKITSIVVDCKLVPTIQGKFLFAEKTHGGAPFPNLRRLEILPHLTNWSTVSLFAVPSVKEVRMEAKFPNAGALVAMVDKYLPFSKLSLESLDICLPDQSDWLPDIRRYPSLAQLTCHISEIRPKTWKIIGNSPNLTHLSIREEETSVRDDGEWDGVSVKLPALRKLVFANETKSSESAILHSVMADLEILQFDLPRGPSKSHQTILAHLAISSPRVRLERVYSVL
ncbi:hypothetical protein M407DRAFT_199051 [Tulasnella calospora MUT 4182]|uniref:Uncharacterized protein n=1 Tax=Tulasnella calospora MUT 4182 TaxID=1051891 RepID=A0A0C3QWQ0_9AGAM|nr:hypothetical protein M407DRAFT_199051 [Tulasnella calospora MUT 4182]